MSEWTQQRRDDYAAGYEFAITDILPRLGFTKWRDRNGIHHRRRPGGIAMPIVSWGLAARRRDGGGHGSGDAR
jgi:hypothetical protein